MKIFKANNHINLVFFITIILIFFRIIDLRIIDFPTPWLRYLISYIVIFLLFKNFLQNNSQFLFDEKLIKLLKLFWLHQIILIIFSLIISNNYFEYKFIFILYVPYIFLTLSIFLTTHFIDNFKYHEYYFKIYIPIIAILLIIFFRDNLSFFTRSNSFIYFFIILFPFIDLKKKIILIILILSVYIFEISWRANILRVTLITFILLLYLFKFIKNHNFILIFKILVLLPVFFIILSVFFEFNIFQYLSQFSKENEILYADTRSFLFKATFNEIFTNKLKLIFGYGINANLFIDSFTFENFELFGEIGRQNQESGFITKIYKTGLIGIVLDILIFLVPGYYSIKYSKNDFSKLIGMLCAINYVLYFIEIPIGLNIDYFVIYLIIGIASLKKIRDKNNLEIKSFLNSN